MAPYAAHTALEPAGRQAEHILRLFYEYFDVSAVVFTLTIAAVGFALGRKPVPENEKREPSAVTTKRKRTVIAWATVATVVTLVALLVASVSTGHAMALLRPEEAIEIEVIGHKWWWEFRYPVFGPATRFNTAYELHIPTGRPVAFKLIARDVIHSFWVPSLSGKRDAIPGKDNVLVLQADRPGVYEGQCAEFCGTEHAHMRFLVVAEAPERFEAWKAHQLGSAPPPTDDLRKRGEQVFLESRCSSCHAISGIDAYGTVGPDLSHVASRKRLAMGTLANDPAHLSRWIADPQLDKPGVQMPGTPLPPNDLRALVAYLEGLQ